MWTKRIRAIRANASKKSHAELDEAEELDTGDSVDLGDGYRKLNERLPNLSVFWGVVGRISGMLSGLRGRFGDNVNRRD